MFQSRPVLRGSRCAGRAVAGRSPGSQWSVLQGIDPIGGRFRTLAERSAPAGGRALQAGAGQSPEVFPTPPTLAGGQNSGIHRSLAGTTGNKPLHQQSARDGDGAAVGAGGGLKSAWVLVARPV